MTTTMATIVNEEKRIVRATIKKEVSPELHKPDIWVQIEIITLREDDEKSKIKRIRLKFDELHRIHEHVNSHM